METNRRSGQLMYKSTITFEEFGGNGSNANHATVQTHGLATWLPANERLLANKNTQE